MKNAFPTCFLLLYLIIINIGCDSNTNFVGSDNLITISRDLTEFTNVVAEDDLEVNINQGNEQTVELIVNDNLIDQLVTRVDNSTLFISVASGSYENENFVVNIELPLLETLILNDNIEAEVDFTSTLLDFEINDSSELQLTGSSETLNIIISVQFSTDILNTTSDDASELKITCNSELNGTVHDAATVSYRGMPTINATTSDAGEIIDAN